MNKLMEIQSELKAPKGQFNSFGKYAYRNCEDILESVKPLLKKHGCCLFISDEIVEMGGRFYVKATATFIDGDIHTKATAFAREAADKKGMDEAQITGAASSYARKYALNGLFLIDDTKDADSLNTHGKEEPKHDADPAFIAKREAEKAKMRQTMQTVLETKPSPSQAPKTASDIATGLIMYANPKNAGGFRSYALENYQKENGRDMMFSTRDVTMIETLDDRLAKEQKVSFRFTPNENPNFAASIVELIAVE